MTLDDLLSLVKAGYTKEEIEKITTPAPAPAAPAPAPAPAAPAPAPAPAAPAPAPAPAPAAPVVPDWVQGLQNEIARLNSTMQGVNISGVQQPSTLPADVAAIANIIQGAPLAGGENK